MEWWEAGWFINNESNRNDHWTIYDNYGFVHVYALTMSLGVIVAILLAMWKLWRKGISLQEIMYGAAIAVPAGLFGASFFGKLNAQGVGSNAGGAKFFGLFAFWEAGMSIHGAILAGAFAGIVIFYFFGRKTKVSVLVYMDCILPSILISQAIGRWGNFFNHEIFGRPVGTYESSALSWLPNWIRDNVTFTYGGPQGQVINGITMQNGVDYVMQPLFLVECLSFVAAWLIITFLIPGIGKWISKKPWKIHPDKYSFDLKYSFKRAFGGTKEEGKLTYTEIWNKAFYRNVNVEWVEKYNKEVNSIEGKNKFIKRWKQGQFLAQANNPDNYKIIKCGVEAGAYFFFWNLVRFSLELTRPKDHLFLNYLPTASYTLVGLTMVGGVIFALVSQFVLPNLTRVPGYYYEKQYFYTEEAIEKEFGSKRSKELSEEKAKALAEKERQKEAKAKEKLEKLKQKEQRDF
ncbi:prolipoprotein diacylglyceryl transferase [Spiroplasma chinense]|uniref:Prolipoprotein diacylglyceryl transferase n=1 Tax=Spiroplasma chinense TaxID=216932 RepID=A0A5B9Y2K5_9MOLU|nr:prolipoprotein diacylglyceryl transferase family protein [Spiroplasma chinense]QEH61304.1 prolipoprotein diacylglyceryl transferase [Spiroplasma chinense]